MKWSHASLLFAGIAWILLACHAISQEVTDIEPRSFEVEKQKTGGVVIRLTDRDVPSKAQGADNGSVNENPFIDDALNSSDQPATGSTIRQGIVKRAPKPAAAPRSNAMHAASRSNNVSLNSTSANTNQNDEILSRGKIAFEGSCVDCHEAERATSEKKTKTQWLVTIRKMAAMDDAEIDPLDFDSIATYLASLDVKPKAKDDAEGVNDSQNDRHQEQTDKDTATDEDAAKSDSSKSDSKKSDSDKNDEEDAEEEQNSKNRSRRSAFDPQIVARGRTAFESSCTKCHDAQRSLSKKKSKSAWLATVRRMARLDGANVASSDFVPIATYLASLSAPPSSTSSSSGGGDGSADDGSMDADIDMEADGGGTFGSGLNVSATISTLFRGGNDNLENPGFFVDAWLRADWQPDGPIRGRVTACTSCHSDQTNDGGFTMELVEATAHLDLMHRIKKNCPENCQPALEAEIKMGRFVVPFGAFASMSHPGSYRTVTNPLMYNMGRQVSQSRSYPPVLPAPFSDEGVDLFLKFPIHHDWNITMDLYGVNGLQGGGSGVQFTPSRSYADNNNEPTLGGRATVGNSQFRFGGSVMAGRMNADDASPLQYRMAGGDATAYFIDNLVRVYFEYGMRTNGTTLPDNQLAYGLVSELELVLIKEPNLSLLARYDTLEHRNFFGDTSIERFTWGVSTTAFGGSLFMINHEHWNFPTDEKDVDVVGFRWVATF